MMLFDNPNIGNARKRQSRRSEERPCLITRSSLIGGKSHPQRRTYYRQKEENLRAVENSKEIWGHINGKRNEFSRAAPRVWWKEKDIAQKGGK